MYFMHLRIMFGKDTYRSNISTNLHFLQNFLKVLNNQYHFNIDSGPPQNINNEKLTKFSKKENNILATKTDDILAIKSGGAILTG